MFIVLCQPKLRPEMPGDSIEGQTTKNVIDDWHASTEFALDYEHAERRVRSLWQWIMDHSGGNAEKWMAETVAVEEAQWAVIAFYHRWGERLTGHARIDFEEQRLVYRCLCGNHIDGAQNPKPK